MVVKRRSAGWYALVAFLREQDERERKRQQRRPQWTAADRRAQNLLLKARVKSNKRKQRKNKHANRA